MKKIVVCCVLWLFGTSLSGAAINLDRTRVIFNADSKNVSVILTNDDDKNPYLAQAWLSDKDDNKIENLFAIVPPIQKLNPKTTVQLRIRPLSTVSSLPQDRESLFFLNVREIPPKAESESSLQIAIHSTLKFFYRPGALQNNDDIWQDKLDVKRPSDDTIVFNNPTPYYIVIGNILDKSGKEVIVSEVDTIAPFSTVEVKTPGFSDKTFMYSFINDLGVVIQRRAQCVLEAGCTLELLGR